MTIMAINATSSEIVDQIESAKTMLTPTYLATLLAVPRKTIYRYVRDRRLPYYKFGRCLRFDPKETAKWLRGRGNIKL